MKYLLDTQTILWFLAGDNRVKTKVRSAFKQPRAELYISSASVWEMAIKSSLGKLELPKSLGPFMEDCWEGGFLSLPVDWRHTVAVQELPHHHRDPFDRLLAAQAQWEGMTLVSPDEAFKAYKVRLFW